MRLFCSKFQETSVTRSLMTGKVFMGWTVMVSAGAYWFMRVMHASRGRPLISMLHEPHLPALQFHRTARSFASLAWTRCSTSRTTMPASTSMRYSTNPPPAAVPLQTRTRRSGRCGLQVLDGGEGDGRELLRGIGSRDDLGLHPPVPPPANDDVHLLPVVALAGVIDARVRAAA